jgi:lipoyl(octanoyl) transferase
MKAGFDFRKKGMADERIDHKNRSAVFTDLGLLEYKRALDLQASTLQSKIKKPLTKDRIFFVEHLPVYTLGKRGGKENLSVSESFLKSENIEIVQTDRGGNITYHGPGQAVLYPIVDLEKNRIGVKDFVYGLEEIMRLTALDFQIQAHRSSKNHGVWVGDAKIGSVGISIKRGISFHGLAMNVNLDLIPFSWINPCGLTNVAMTSIKKELQDSNQDQLKALTSQLSMDKIKESFIRHFSSIFNFTVIKDNNT